MKSCGSAQAIEDQLDRAGSLGARNTDSCDAWPCAERGCQAFRVASASRLPLTMVEQGLKRDAGWSCEWG
jgi:hypothetical protein